MTFRMLGTHRGWVVPGLVNAGNTDLLEASRFTDGRKGIELQCLNKNPDQNVGLEIHTRALDCVLMVRPFMNNHCSMQLDAPLMHIEDTLDGMYMMGPPPTPPS